MAEVIRANPEDFEDRAGNCRQWIRRCRDTGDEQGVRDLERTLTAICGEAEKWAFGQAATAAGEELT